jgi:flagellar protein FlgJ
MTWLFILLGAAVIFIVENSQANASDVGAVSPQSLPSGSGPDWFSTAIATAAASANMRGIPVSFMAAQAAQESGWGSSNLAKNYNSLFGIAAVGSTNQYWKGAAHQAADGQPTRAYDKWSDSISDWARLIQTRYPDAYASARSNNIQGFAQLLVAGGYNTADPTYASAIVSIYRGHFA